MLIPEGDYKGARWAAASSQRDRQIAATVTSKASVPKPTLIARLPFGRAEFGRAEVRGDD